MKEIRVESIRGNSEELYLHAIDMNEQVIRIPNASIVKIEVGKREIPHSRYFYLITVNE